MKEWPKDGGLFNFRDLVGPVRTAIEFAYRLERRNTGRSIPWDGPNVGDRTLVCGFSPVEKLRCDNLKYSDEEQGRDALTEIVGIAVQLGIEQGRRMAVEKLDTPFVMIEQSSEMIRQAMSSIRERGR